MEASPDTDDDALSDADILNARREALRGFVDAIARHIQTLDLPETYLEAERAARAITVHDRAIETLPLTVGDNESDHAQSAIKPLRRQLRRYADRVMEAVTFIPKPLCFLEGERAGRYALAADRMLAQLYEAPRADTAKSAKAPRFADDLDDEDDQADTDDWRAEFLARAERYATGCARNSGIWPDGTAFDKDAPAPEHPWRLADSLTIFQCEGDPAQKARWPALLMLNRANAVTRAMARREGRWPDHTLFGEDDPDYYSLAAGYDERVLDKPPVKDTDRPPKDHKEHPNTIGFPWWLVRKGPKEPLPPLRGPPSPLCREGEEESPPL